MAGTILLTGASGYVGSRLLRVLEEGGCAVRCLAREPERVTPSRASTAVVAGDCLDEASLVAAMDEVDQAYYLVHSMASGPGFAALDRRAASNFGHAAARAGVRRIIYLGGLGDAPESLSTHLRSRMDTGEALREAGVPVVEFRASVIVGAGSLSFEMIRALVERLPVMRGLPRRIAEHAAPRVALVHVSAFTYGSIIGAPAAEVFRWHEQPGALAALTPPRLVRIEQQEGGIHDGGRVTVSVGIGSVRMRWVLRHYGYCAGRRFCDEQVRGPFAVWRHTHLFEPIGSSQTLYQDRIEFAVGRGAALNRLAAAVLRPLLTLAFASRHRIVQGTVGRGRRRVAPRWAATVAIAAAAMLQPANARAQAPPVRTVPFVNLDRYAGDWFEIARFENRFQRQCVGDVRASYAQRADGRIAVANRCRTADGQIEAHGVARLVDEQTHAKLKVRFAPAWLSWLPAVWGDYWIIGLAPDYSWAVVGDPGRQYLWILARMPRLDPESMAAARTAAQDNGFDVGRLAQTPQAAGRP